MENTTPMNAIVINTKKYAIYILTYMLGGIFLSALFAWKLGHEILLWIGVFVFGICPIIFKRQFRRKFTKKATIKCSVETICINTIDRETEETIESQEFRYSEIESYKAMNSSTENSSLLKLYLKNKEKVSYTFLEQKADDISSVINVVSRYFQQYNQSVDENSKIALRPSLFITNAGRNIIIVLGVGWCILLVLQIKYKPKTIPASIFGGLILYLQILAQRKKDTERYNKMK